MSKPASPHAELVRRALEARRRWVEVEPGVELQVQRPGDAEIVMRASGPVLDLLAGCLVGWRGVTLGHLLGEAALDVERQQAADFAPELARLALSDHAEWTQRVSEVVFASIEKRLAEREAAEKN